MLKSTRLLLVTIALALAPFSAYAAATALQWGVDRTTSPWTTCIYDQNNVCQGAFTIPATGGGVLLPASRGGTGVNNGSSTITLGGSLSTSGAFALSFTLTGGTSLTLPTSGTVTALGNTTTGSGSIVLATSPTLTTPNLGTPSSINLANATNLPASALPPNPNFTSVSINGVAIRAPVNAAQSYYVNPSGASTAACGPAGVSTCQPGSNLTGNGTIAAPWQTLAFAVSAVQSGYDFRGNSPTIYLAHGTDTGNVQCHNNGANVGRVVIFIQGDSSSPTSTVIQSPNGGEGIFVKDYCALSLQSLTIADQGSALTGVHVGQVGIVDFNNVHFTAFSATGVFIHEEQGASASITQAPIYLDGGGKNWLKIESGAVFYASDGVPLTGEHIEIDSAVAFTKGLAAIGPASLVGFSASTFTGSGVATTTGIRAALVGPVYLQGNAAACASIFPGNSACTLTQGAGDDGLDTLTTQLPVASGGTGTGTAGATAVGNISAATPVSCPSGVTAATVVVVNGIITHC